MTERYVEPLAISPVEIIHHKLENIEAAWRLAHEGGAFVLRASELEYSQSRYGYYDYGSVEHYTRGAAYYIGKDYPYYQHEPERTIRRKDDRPLHAHTLCNTVYFQHTVEGEADVLFARTTKQYKDDWEKWSRIDTRLNELLEDGYTDSRYIIPDGITRTRLYQGDTLAYTNYGTSDGTFLMHSFRTVGEQRTYQTFGKSLHQHPPR